MSNPPPAPPGMVLIPAGTFRMGNATNVFPAGEGESDELPQHTVYVSVFYIDNHEVTKAQWDEVRTYGTNNGYTFPNEGSGKATNHPVHTVDWYDVVRWCNARSEKDGLTPVYYMDAGFSNVYRAGEVTPYPSWAANGYGLRDMAGNVWEWCWDWYDGYYYQTAPLSDPRGAASGAYRVLRGGAWNNGANNARVAYRADNGPGVENVAIGFRCARGL